jgi:hypothetical protein
VKVLLGRVIETFGNQSGFVWRGCSFYTLQQFDDILRNVRIRGGSSGVVKVLPEGWARSEAGGFDFDVAGDTGAEGAGGLDSGGGTGVRGFRKANGLGKLNGSVNRALGFALGPFVSSMGTSAVTSRFVAAAAGASDAGLSVPLARFGAENAALPCPGRTVGLTT